MSKLKLDVNRQLKSGVWWVPAVAALALTGCGQSQFAREIAAICAEDEQAGRDCECIASQLDENFPDHLKPAFVALRWPLRPAPEDRDAVNGAMLRSIGVDPSDRAQTRSAVREFRDVYYPMRDGLRSECGGSL